MTFVLAKCNELSRALEHHRWQAFIDRTHPFTPRARCQSDEFHFKSSNPIYFSPWIPNGRSWNSSSDSPANRLCTRSRRHSRMSVNYGPRVGLVESAGSVAAAEQWRACYNAIDYPPLIIATEHGPFRAHTMDRRAS